LLDVRRYALLCRQEKAQGPSGQRVNKWYLVDAAGKEHLAVVAHERETRDGHYSYRAQPPFEALQPLESSNMAVGPPVPCSDNQR
jgi:hypothetical protein